MAECTALTSRRLRRDRSVTIHDQIGGAGDSDPWDDARRDRHARLCAWASPLGWLYGTAVNLLPASTERGPFTIIAHCVREIFNRYSEWDGVIIKGAQEELAEATLALAKLWPGGLEDDEIDFDAEDLEEQRLVAAAEVAARHHDGTDNNLRRALWFVGGVSAMTDGHPATLRSAKEVLRHVGFFVKYAHIAPAHQPPSQYLVRERFADFERAIDLALRDALDVEDALNDVLRSANRRTDETGEAR